MKFTDRVLTCIDCSAEFVFTAGEQFFFHDKEFKNDPKCCKQCKAKRSSGNQRICSDDLCGVWRRDLGSVQTDARKAGALSVVL